MASVVIFPWTAHHWADQLVNLLHGGSTRGSTWGCTTPKTATWHSTLWHLTSATCRLVHLHHDWVHHTLDLFLLCFKLILLSKLVFVKPVKRVLHCLLDFLFVTTFKLVFQ